MIAYHKCVCRLRLKIKTCVYKQLSSGGIDIKFSIRFSNEISHIRIACILKTIEKYFDIGKLAHAVSRNLSAAILSYFLSNVPYFIS